ncbi:NADPH-dependent FMN reductase [Bacillus thuringiensis]|uniref:NADPH-dependent FMN reductase n=1 Tax=Bacillus TaxID=1386 RepID=UPI000468E1F6|nr:MULTISPECIES: NADPH-dependent FMN reductase [Bacillus]MCM3218741.1 NAD(P)H-dependent oxidoreductase [Bacillus cereus]MED3272711.1 NAD(P)H-dependent oxidoreductase [Bacillus thuringiensis]MED3618934.1 NAD(P)H-dependent oxidoreductase [Bacillus thuringiensis]OTW52189.1 NADPH-dependent FMN reductase [Bacillus thuringiensis serovar silo]OTW61708.1 NADPH-dependent FMN reductase [Bacillus thuringiensis serovar toguchini]
MKLVVINGTPRKFGRTRVVAKYIADQFEGELYDLAIEELPLYNGEESQRDLEAVKKLKTLVKAADGVVLCTPEYHNTMSGALKNSLDYLSSSEFIHKPVALLAVAGGGKGGINALNSMRTVARGVYANAIPKQVVLDGLHVQDGELGEDAKPLIHDVVKELKAYMSVYKEVKKQLGVE